MLFLTHVHTSQIPNTGKACWLSNCRLNGNFLQQGDKDPKSFQKCSKIDNP